MGGGVFWARNQEFRNGKGDSEAFSWGSFGEDGDGGRTDVRIYSDLIFTWWWCRLVLVIRFAERGQRCRTDSEEHDKDSDEHRQAAALGESLQGLGHGEGGCVVNY